MLEILLLLCERWMKINHHILSNSGHCEIPSAKIYHVYIIIFSYQKITRKAFMKFMKPLLTQLFLQI